MPPLTIAQSDAAFRAGKTNMMNPYSQDHYTRDFFKVNYFKKMQRDFMRFAQYTPFPARGLDHVIPTLEMLHEHKETLAKVLEREGVEKLIDRLTHDSIFYDDAIGLSFERFLDKCMTEMKLTRFQMHCIMIYRESLDHSLKPSAKPVESEEEITRRKEIKRLQTEQNAILRRFEPMQRQLEKYQRLHDETKLELHKVEEQLRILTEE